LHRRSTAALVPKQNAQKILVEASNRNSAAAFYTEQCGDSRYFIARLFLQIRTIGDQEANNLPIQ
jgi:hypothetical protein